MARDAETAFAGTSRFEIVRRLGIGGMGVVYEAVDRARDTRVALKTLRNMDPHALFLFKNEFRALQGIDHPNLVRLGELIEDRGEWFFTMELLDGDDFVVYARPESARREATESMSTGETLQSSVPHMDTTGETIRGSTIRRPDTPLGAIAAGARNRPRTIEPRSAEYDEARLRAALVGLARGLVALHDAGKVHRDIKPSNIRVTAEGRAVLLDFGLVADSASRPPTDSNVVGTVAYMAPEQAAGAAVTPAADWYAVGAVLYEALTGWPPFRGAPLDVLSTKQQTEPTPARELVPDVSDDLAALCADLLRIDPDRRLTGRAVLDRLGHEPEPAPALRPADAARTAERFVGRAGELAALRAAFDDARGGEATVVFVHGPSGLGKSALLRRLADEVSDAGALVLAGRCYERESVPYKAFDGIVDALASHLRAHPDAIDSMADDAALLPRLFPVLASVDAINDASLPSDDLRDPHEIRARAFAALRGLFERLTARAPVVLVIDDLQWADTDSLVLIGDLLRPPAAPPVLLMGSSRRGTDSHAARVLGAEVAGVRFVELDALEPDAARVLARRLLRERKLSGVSPARIAAEARGHPLYIDELVRHAALDPTADRLRLDEAIWSRVERMPDDVRRVLELVAIAGAPIPQAALARATALPAGDLAHHVTTLRVANLVKTDGSRDTDAIETYHDRVRESVVENVGDEARRAHHAKLATALAATGAERSRPELLLRHLEAAGKPLEAARLAVTAARRAAEALAFDRAAELFRTALRLDAHGGHATARAGLLVDLGDALTNAGRGREAADALLDAAALAGDELAAECRRRAALQLLITGHIARGLEVLDVLLAREGASLPSSPWTAVAGIAWRRARLRVRGTGWTERDEADIGARALARVDVYQVVGEGLSVVDPIRAMAFQSRALLAALAAGEKTRVARALGVEGMFVSSMGVRSFERGMRLVAEATAIAERVGDPVLLAASVGAQGIVHYMSGRFGEAAALLARAEHAFRTTTAGATWELNNSRLFHLLSRRHAGDVTGRHRLMQLWVRDATRRGDLYAATSMRRASNFSWLARDQPDRASADLEATSWTPPEGGFHLQHWWELEAGAELALYDGTIAGAFDRLAPAFRALRRSLLTRVQMVRALSRWLEGRVHLAMADTGSDARRSLAAAARLARALDREQADHATVFSRLLAAGVAHRRGNTDRAVEHLRVAAGIAGDVDMEHLAATARRRIGELTGDDEAVAVADAWMHGAGIAAPARLSNVVAPGFVGR